MRRAQAADAFTSALRLLNYRARSQQELRRRLVQKGFARSEVDNTIERLLELGYIDDKALAESLSDSARGHRMLGKAGAKRFLRSRGIGPDDTEEALEGYEEYEQALRLVEKRLPSMDGLARDVRVRRLSGQLRRRGFSASTVRRALDRIIKD